MSGFADCEFQKPTDAEEVRVSIVPFLRIHLRPIFPSSYQLPCKYKPPMRSMNINSLSASAERSKSSTKGTMPSTPAKKPAAPTPQRLRAIWPDIKAIIEPRKGSLAIGLLLPLVGTGLVELLSFGFVLQKGNSATFA